MKIVLEPGEVVEYRLRVRRFKRSKGRWGGNFIAQLLSPSGKIIGRGRDWSAYFAANKAIADAQLRRKL